MPNRITDTLQTFFATSDLPDIIAAINAANVSYIEHRHNRSRRNVADTVHLTNRAAEFLIKLNDVWVRVMAQQ